MKNIEELNATIEELEKRIKAISSAGATLAQIIAVRDSLEQVKVCLNNLTTAIKDEEDDASVAQLTALEQRVTTAETDITTLQTDLTSTQDDLETVWNNLASTNSVVGEHTTTLTNLQTAQTNLQTTQTNQASTITTNTTDISNLKTRMTTAENTNTTQTNNINSLTTRMTTAENNISALTGGIDVGNLENRINELDEEVRPIFTGSYIRSYQDFNGMTINNLLFMSNMIAFTSSNYEKIRVKATIKATIPPDSDSRYICIKSYTCNIYKSSNVFNADTNEYILDYTYIPKNRYDELYVHFYHCRNAVLNSVEIEVYGTELKQVDLYRNLNVICFNNYRYLTYKKNDTYYYGKYATTDTIDLDNIPNTFAPTNTNNSLMYDFVYTPAIKVSSDDTTLSNNADGYLLFSPTEHYINAFNPPEDNTTKYFTDGTTFIHGLPVWGYKRPFTAKMKSGVPAGANMNVNNGYSIFSPILNYQKGEWLLAYDIIDNYLTDNSNVLAYNNYCALFLNENGYIYFAHEVQLNYVTKIAKGEFAIGYKQPDGSINVYITKKHNVYKYKVTKNTSTYKYEPTLIKTYENCDIVYEILNNQIIKCYKNEWSIVSE
ncbi:MAG: hypothetical protein SOV27_04125 [Eubacteriales bacterium]|nr:hypothetical protein [Eubacteriales bacterium]